LDALHNRGLTDKNVQKLSAQMLLPPPRPSGYNNRSTCGPLPAALQQLPHIKYLCSHVQAKWLGSTISREAPCDHEVELLADSKMTAFTPRLN